MLKVSRASEYGIIALKYIYQQPVGYIASAREIAEKYNIPAEIMAKIMQKMVKQGLVMSCQGARGGYALAKPPAQISVAEIVQSIEGPIGIVECVSDPDCECTQLQTGVCNIKDPFAKIQNKFIGFLTGISLADLN
jgi:Rrf2 family protein